MYVYCRPKALIFRSVVFACLFCYIVRMSDISDYLVWRGDILFKMCAFNEIDALILCQLSYIPFDGIVPSDFKSGITLREAARSYVKNGTAHSLGVFINPRSVQLLEQAGESERFGPVVLKAFVNDISIAEEKQFCALTALLPSKETCVVFRGTDDSIIGWKEDFNMAVLDPVPAQTAARTYLSQALSRCRGTLYTVGHSKGGNLAVYAPFALPHAAQKRIRSIFCFDGPGFKGRTQPVYSGDLKKIKSFVPQSSVVGILLDYPKNHTVVESSENNGLLQHDAFSWKVKGTAFVTKNERSADSLFTEKTVQTWLAEMDTDRRKAFIDALFSLIEATGSRTLTELRDNWFYNSAAIIKSLHSMDFKTKKNVFAIITLFFKAAGSNIPRIKGLTGASKNAENNASPSSK